MKDREFLIWIHERLEKVHGENKNVDYMHKLRSIISSTSPDRESKWGGSRNIEDLHRESKPDVPVKFCKDCSNILHGYLCQAPENGLNHVDEKPHLWFAMVSRADDRCCGPDAKFFREKVVVVETHWWDFLKRI